MCTVCPFDPNSGGGSLPLTGGRFLPMGAVAQGHIQRDLASEGPVARAVPGKHVLISVGRIGRPMQYVARCSCSWRSELMPSRSKAVEAFAAHLNEQ